MFTTIFNLCWVALGIAYGSQIKSCNESLPYLQLCLLTETYNNGIPDYVIRGSPTSVQTFLSLFQLADINEIANTVTISMIFGAHWNDTRLSMKGDDSDRSSIWYKLNEEDTEQIHVPEIRFENLKEIKVFGNWGPKDSQYFWLEYPHTIHFHQAIQVKLFCSLEFSSYPFDHHYCDMTFGSASNNVKQHLLPPPIILDDNDQPVEEMKSVKINQTELAFEIHLETIVSFNQSSFGYFYPFSGIRIHLKRNKLGLLYGGFYGPTGLFALLSLTSYTINPDVVPGRLGVLVTLYLIASNVYGSVKGPPSRGFSYIEVWMIGVQVPILTAIIEYAVILTMKKYQLKHQEDFRMVQARHSSNKMTFDKLAIEIDKWTFIASLTFIIIFGLVYCGIALTITQ